MNGRLCKGKLHDAAVKTVNRSTFPVLQSNNFFRVRVVVARTQTTARFDRWQVMPLAGEEDTRHTQAHNDGYTLTAWRRFYQTSTDCTNITEQLVTFQMLTIAFV